MAMFLPIEGKVRKGLPLYLIPLITKGVIMEKAYLCDERTFNQILTIKKVFNEGKTITGDVHRDCENLLWLIVTNLEENEMSSEMLEA